MQGKVQILTLLFFNLNKKTMIYNPYPQINLPFGNDNKYFKWLFDAICNVKNTYINYKVKYVTTTDKESELYHLERVSAYELYRQWANILEKQTDTLVLNAEVDKSISYSIEAELEDSTNQEYKINVFPDIVLHHSQGDDRNQKMICEIKRNKYLTASLILGDLFKLSCYMDNEHFHSDYLPFEYGVFILIGTNIDTIRNLLVADTNIKKGDARYSVNNYKREFSHTFNHIVCIAYNGTILEYETLDKIIK